MTDISTRRPLVLLVEDDEQVRSLIRSILSPEGLTILDAATGAEGLRVAEEHGEEIDILITDMLLPELSGYDLAAELRVRFPNLAIILMTGYITGEIIQRGISELNASFLDKPFQPSELRNMVARALASGAHVS